MKVIGVGGPRTGTTSLKLALEMLGYNKCYHMKELLNNPDQVVYWEELFQTGKTDFETLFDGYQAITDFPGHLNYKALYEQYPDAKFILTDRDPESWYQSLSNTVYQANHPSIGRKLTLMRKMLFSVRLRKISRVFKLLKNNLWQGFFKGQFKDKELAIKRYNDFNEEIKQTIPPDKLLIYKVSDQWEPLCKFLELPIPKEDFPHLNKREEFKTQVGKMLKTGGRLEIN